MEGVMADCLANFRRFNYERIYMRPASRAQGRAVIDVLRALVEFFADRPNRLPHAPAEGLDAGSQQAARAAVTYVAGMTDLFAFQTAIAELGWDSSRLPGRWVDARWPDAS